MRFRLLIALAAIVLASVFAEAQERRRSDTCQYQIPLGDLPDLGPLRLPGRTRNEAITFQIERARIPAAGTEIHLFIRHSPDLDGVRSFISVTLNYALLRSLRLDYDGETEVVIPVSPELLKRQNELLLSVQHFSNAAKSAAEMWTEIDGRSFVLVRCKDVRPVLDLTDLPYPLVDPHSQRDQRLNVLVPQRISDETLEATALIVANLSRGTKRAGSRVTSIETVSTPGGLNGPLLIVGTPTQQPLLAQLERRLPASTDFDSLSQSEGLAALVTRTDRETSPILIVTGKSSAGVLQAARGLFNIRSDSPVAAAKIGFTPKRTADPRDWPGFVPPTARFSLEDLQEQDFRLGPGPRRAAVVRLDTTADARFLEYGLQARLFFDIRQAAGSDHSFLEVSLNGNSLGRFPLRDISSGSKASIRINAPAQLLRTRNILEVLWDEENGDIDGEGWLLRSSEFYLPRYYSSDLPDLSLLREYFYPFSLKPDLSDTVIAVPDTVDPDIYGALMQLAVHIGSIFPGDTASFSVRSNQKSLIPFRNGSHFIFLNVERGQPAAQETVSPWDPRKYVLKITATTSAGLRQFMETFFSEQVFNTLKGDTVYLTQAQPVMRQVSPRRRVEENFYLTRIEAWLRSNWIALPLILGSASVLMFVALRLALNQYRMRSNGAV